MKILARVGALIVCIGAGMLHPAAGVILFGIYVMAFAAAHRLKDK